MANVAIVGTSTITYSTPTHVLLFVKCSIISEINVKWPSKLMHAVEREISFVIGYVLKY
jgi:hypothetical protein